MLKNLLRNFYWRIAAIGINAVWVARDPRSRTAELRRWLREYRQDDLITARRPWWPYPLIDAVAENLPRGAEVFEFGGGGSSLWLHDHGARLTVVEHHRGWYETLRHHLPEDVTLLLREPRASGTVGSESEPGHFFDDYRDAIAEVPDASLDLVVVDGRARVACGIAAMSKVRPGGMLLLDDSQRARYALLGERLAAWHRMDYRGLKSGGDALGQATVWRKGSS